MIEVIPAQDYKLLARLNEEIQMFHHLGYPGIFKPYDRLEAEAFFRDSLAKEDTKAFIASEDGVALGYILLFLIHFSENPFQYARKYILIDQILVLKEHRQKGIGRKLVEKAIAFAQDNKVQRIELNHWSLNPEAGDFFSKQGFEYYNNKMWMRMGAGI